MNARVWVGVTLIPTERLELEAGWRLSLHWVLISEAREFFLASMHGREVKTVSEGMALWQVPCANHRWRMEDS